MSASLLYEVAALYSHPGAREPLRWNWEGALEATAFLMTGTVNVTPGLQSAPIETLRQFQALDAAIARSEGLRRPRPRVPKAVRARLGGETTRWALENAPSIRRRYAALERTDQFTEFAEQHRSNNWLAHPAGGVFTRELIGPLAAITETAPAELDRLWQRTVDEDYIARIRRRAPFDPGDEIALLRKLYFLSSLIRTHYREALAREENWQVLHHRFQETILDELETERYELDFEPPVAKLTRIIVASGFTEPNAAQRIDKWVNAVAEVNRRIRRDPAWLETSQSDAGSDDARSERIAFRAAHDLGIGGVSKKMERALEIGGKFLLGFSLRHVLERWPLAADGLQFATDSAVERGTRAITEATERRRLRNLVSAYPGRFRRLPR